MSCLLEYWESGNAPHEALGRAARRLASGGALYLGGGVGVERQQTAQGATTYRLTSATGAAKGEEMAGPLSAVIRAFALAGTSTKSDTPGGPTVISDPAVAARLRELNDEEAEAKRNLQQYVTRLARRQRQPQRPFSPGGSVAMVDDDNWEARRIEELRADLSRISAERRRLISTGKIEERAETGKPGTNWKQVTPAANAKLSGLKAHYAKMAHPFRQCVLDNTKRFGKDGAERVCAVLKDLIRKTTKWRKGGGGKVSEEVALVLEAALGRVVVAEEELGLGMSVALVEADVALLAPAAAALAEGLAQDYALLALAGHPLAEALFPAEEAAKWDPGKHPRDPEGQFAKVLGGLKRGEVVELPHGTKVQKSKLGHVVDTTLVTGSPATVAQVAHERDAAKGNTRTLRAAAQAAIAKSAAGPPRRKAVAPPGAAIRGQIRQALGALSAGQRYSVVGGQGQPRGHVEKTAQGWEITLPSGKQTAPSAAAAALVVDRFERQEKANELARQKRRGRQYRTEEEVASAGIGLLLEAFGPPPMASEPRADAQRNVAGSKKKKKPTSGGSSGDSKRKRATAGRPEGGRFIGSGSSGEDVRAVQRKVGAKTDGKYGSKTKKAVMDYQKRHGLKVDGVVGRQTSLAMRGHYRTARSTQPGALHKVDSDALKRMRRGSKGRSGKTGMRARGGMTV